MSSRNSSSTPLTIDYSQEDELSHPNASVVSSRGMGWDQLQLSLYQLPSDYYLPEHSAPHYLICINYSNPVDLHATVDGKSKTIKAVPSSLNVFPANVLQKFLILEEVTFLDLYLEPALLTQAGIELCEKDNIDLVPKLEYRLDPLIYQIAIALKTALEADRSGSKLYSDAMATALATHLIFRYSSCKPAIKNQAGELAHRRLKQVIAYIHEYVDRDLSLVELANVAQLSPFHFARLFKQATGMAPHRYHLQCRVEHAKKLLREGELAIAEIASVVGFSSQGHLNYHFKRFVGVTPTVFLQQQ